MADNTSGSDLTSPQHAALSQGLPSDLEPLHTPKPPFPSDVVDESAQQSGHGVADGGGADGGGAGGGGAGGVGALASTAIGGRLVDPNSHATFPTTGRSLDTAMAAATDAHKRHVAARVASKATSEEKEAMRELERTLEHVLETLRPHKKARKEAETEAASAPAPAAASSNSSFLPTLHVCFT